MPFEGLDNVRDVGGLPLRDGGSTRSGVLLRSAALHWATPQDVRRLVDEFGLRLVLDLRTPREIDRDGPTPIATAGVETVALNLIGASRELPETEDDTDPLLRNYLGYLDDQPANIVEAVHQAFKAAMADPRVDALLDSYIQAPWYKSPAEYRAFAEKILRRGEAAAHQGGIGQGLRAKA